VARGSNTVTTFGVADDGTLLPPVVPSFSTGIQAANPSAGIALLPGLDVDGDGLNPLVDNCPEVSNPGQEDANADGAGDACQPRVNILAVVPAEFAAGGDLATVPVLAAGVSLDDPDGQPLRGRAIVSERETVDVTLLDAGTSAMSSDFIDCGRGLALEERPGEGIAFLNASVGQPDLIDQDGILACNDGLQDFAIAAGACGPIDPLGTDVLPLRSLSLPALVCVRSIAEP